MVVCPAGKCSPSPPSSPPTLPPPNKTIEIMQMVAAGMVCSQPLYHAQPPSQYKRFWPNIHTVYAQHNWKCKILHRGPWKDDIQENPRSKTVVVYSISSHSLVGQPFLTGSPRHASFLDQLLPAASTCVSLYLLSLPVSASPCCLYLCQPLLAVSLPVSASPCCLYTCVSLSLLSRPPSYDSKMSDAALVPNKLTSFVSTCGKELTILVIKMRK